MKKQSAIQRLFSEYGEDALREFIIIFITFLLLIPFWMAMPAPVRHPSGTMDASALHPFVSKNTTVSFCAKVVSLNQLTVLYDADPNAPVVGWTWRDQMANAFMTRPGWTFVNVQGVDFSHRKARLAGWVDAGALMEVPCDGGVK